MIDFRAVMVLPTGEQVIKYFWDGGEYSWVLLDEKGLLLKWVLVNEIAEQRDLGVNLRDWL